MSDSYSPFLSPEADAPALGVTQHLSNEEAAKVTHDDYDGHVDTDEYGEVVEEDNVPELVGNPEAGFDLAATIDAELVPDQSLVTDLEMRELATVPDETDASEDDEDPVVAFRTRLEMQPGYWYVLHTYSGFEKRVKENLENRAKALGLEDSIYEVCYPEQEVTEYKDQKAKTKMEKTFPGYVLVRLEMVPEAERAYVDEDPMRPDPATLWRAVRETPGVTGFLEHGRLPGQPHVPLALTVDEVFEMLRPPAPKPKATVAAKSKIEAGADASARRYDIDLDVNDSVLVVEGPFAGLHATVTEIHFESEKVKGLVALFGRDTPVELGFNQIQKN